MGNNGRGWVAVVVPCFVVGAGGVAVRPQVIVISAGADNSYGHPAPAMLARAAEIGATVLRTDEVGTVEVVSDGERMWWDVGGGP